MILVINNHSKHIPSLLRILRKLKVKYVLKDQHTLFKTLNYKRIKGIILSGGGPALDKMIYFNRIRADVSCLINFKVPILGICAGHEIIGMACGGEIVKLKKLAIDKKQPVQLLTKAKIFRGLPSIIEVYEHHTRYLKAIPDILAVTASSRKDRIEAIFHKTRPIFGVQFHPERSGKIGEKIIKNFVDLT